MFRVLVTDGEQRSALAIVRSLGKAGHLVTVCSRTARPLAGASRFSHACERVPDPRADAPGFAEAVRRLAETNAIDVILPATDVSALPLITATGLPPGVTIAFPDHVRHQAVSDKRRLLETAANLGVRVPGQFVLEASGERGPHAEAWARERRFDVVVKPARSARATSGAVASFSVGVARSEREYRRILEAYPEEAYPLLLQERVRGPGLGVFMLAREGEPLASFAHRRIREKPPTGGVSVYRESVPVREDVRHAAEAILRHYGWTGVAMVEFKEDASTGEAYLMEVNGRFWGSLQLAIDAGVDFPVLLLRMMAGEVVEPVTSYRVGLRSRWLWGDFDHLLWVLRKGASYRDDFPEIPSPLRALGRFVLPWRPGDRLEVLRLSDPGPFLRESLQWLGDATRRG